MKFHDAEKCNDESGQIKSGRLFSEETEPLTEDKFITVMSVKPGEMQTCDSGLRKNPPPMWSLYPWLPVGYVHRVIWFEGSSGTGRSRETPQFASHILHNLFSTHFDRYTMHCKYLSVILSQLGVHNFYYSSISEVIHKS